MSTTFWLRKVSVAGSWLDRDAIHERMKQLRTIDGISITHDWTRSEAKGADDRTDEENAACANADIQGVKDCDILIVDLTRDGYPYQGTSVEWGVALGLGRPVWIIRDKTFRSVFYHADGVTHFKSWDEVIAALRRS